MPAVNFKRSRIWVLVLIGLSFGACAKKSENVAASYVSPLGYQQFNCRQLAEEAGRVSQRAAELSGVQNRKRPATFVATTAAIIVFWPAAFLVGEAAFNAREGKSDA